MVFDKSEIDPNTVDVQPTSGATTQPVKPVDPKQADYISRYTNTALSTLSAQMHSVMQMGHGIDRRLLRIRPHDFDVEKGSEFWATLDRFDESHQSDNYRRYTKDETLTQVGMDTVLASNPNVKLGVALSHSDADQRFDDNVRADGTTNMVSMYGRVDGKRVFATADIGAGKGQYDILSEGDKSENKHTVFKAGVNVGATFNTLLVDIQPSIGARYYRLSDDTYHINDASVYVDDVDLVSYQAGLALQKTIPLANGLVVTPSVGSYYVDTSGAKGTVTINNKHTFNQEFGRYGYHEASIGIGQKTWAASVHASLTDGDEVDKRNSVGARFSYKW